MPHGTHSSDAACNPQTRPTRLEIIAHHTYSARLDYILRQPNSVAKVLGLVSDERGSDEAASFVSMQVAEFLTKAWGLRNKCKHAGLLQLHTELADSTARHGADGIPAVA